MKSLVRKLYHTFLLCQNIFTIFIYSIPDDTTIRYSVKEFSLLNTPLLKYYRSTYTDINFLKVLYRRKQSLRR